MTSTPGGDRLRDAFAASAEVAGDGCPGANEIWAAVACELPPEDIRSIVFHTSSCGSCADAWRMAHVAIVREGLAAPAAPADGPAWRSPWVLAPAAAAAALLIGGVLLDPPFDPRRPAASSTLRSTTDALIEPTPSDGAVIDREHLMLRWTAGGEGTRYDVSVATGDLTVVSRAAGLTTPEFKVPPSAVSEFPSGTKLFWQVASTGPDQVRTVSTTFMIQLR